MLRKLLNSGNYMIYRKLLKDKPTKILLNVCTAILGMLICFLVASAPSLNGNSSACKVLIDFPNRFS